jgi:hypothetical protein
VNGGRADRPIFVLRLRPEPGADAIRGLRGLLKVARRRFGLRCISCDEEFPATQELTAEGFGKTMKQKEISHD